MSEISPDRNNTEKLLSTSRQVIDGHIEVLDGVRQIYSLAMRIDPDNPIFLPIRAMESETDHFPSRTAREKFNADALAALDAERLKYFESAREDLIDACRNIIREYS